GSRPGAMPSITWHEAMDRYGSDKPDVRFGLELVDVTSAFSITEFRAFQAEAVKGVRVPGGADTSRSRLDQLTDKAKQSGAAGLVWMRVHDGGVLESPVAKFLDDGERAALLRDLAAEPGDLLLMVAGERRIANHVLGILRLEL